MGTMQWKGFYDNDRIENEKKAWDNMIANSPAAQANTPYFQSKLTDLAINYKYLNDALTLKELKEIQFTEFVKAITFIYKDGSNYVVMPMQLD